MHTNAGNYLTGMLTGILIYELKDTRLNIDKNKVFVRPQSLTERNSI